MESGSRRLGILQILASGVCFGFLGLFGKAAFASGMTPGELLSFRFLFAGVLLGVFFLVTNPRKLLIGRRATLACLGLGIFGYAVFSSCYFEALTGLSASLTVLLLYLYPVMVALGAWIFFGERIEGGKWLAIPLVMSGLFLLIWGDIQVLHPYALLFGIGSAVFYSAYILASSRLLRGVDAFAGVVYIQLGAGVVLALVHWRDTSRIAQLVENNWLLISGMAVICTIAAMALFLAGLKKLRNWEVSILSTGEPVMGILLALVFLGERFTLSQGFGAFAVLGAFLIVANVSETNKENK